MTRRGALLPKLRSWPLPPHGARSFLMAMAMTIPLALSAHPVNGPVSTRTVQVDLNARTIAIFDRGTRLAIDFVPSGGATRARLTQSGAYRRVSARLLVPSANGNHVDVRFLGSGRVRLSDPQLSKLVDGSILELHELGQTHRIVLRDASR